MGDSEQVVEEAVEEVKPEPIEYTARGFDLEKFDRVKLEGTIEFTPPTNFEEALARLNGDKDKMLEFVVAGIREKAISEAKAERIAAQPNVVPSNKIVQNVIAGFAIQPQFAAISDRKERRQAIYAFIKSNEALVASVRALATAAPSSDDEDDEDGEED